MRKSLKIMNYKFNQAQSTNRIVLQNLIRVGACLRPWGEGAESGEEVELLDGWVSALEEGDRVVAVMLMAYLSSSYFCSEFYKNKILPQLYNILLK